MSDMKEMCTVVHKPDPEEKKYFVCFRSHTDHWMICDGRKDAYEYLKECIRDGMEIDLDDGFVLVETCTLNQRKSLVKFIKFCQNIYKDGFDIDDYIDDYSETDYDHEYNAVNSDFTNNIDRLDMQSILNGETVIEEG